MLYLDAEAVALHSACEEGLCLISLPLKSPAGANDVMASPPGELAAPVPSQEPAALLPPSAGSSTQLVEVTSPPAQPPSTQTKQAIDDLYDRSCEGLEADQRLQLRKLLDLFSDIFAARHEDCTHTSLVHHNIDTGNAHPICLHPRRLPLTKRALAEQKIKEMMEAGIIEPSTSPWVALVVLVKKKDGTWWCFCVDYRLLNKVTRKDSYPLPLVDDALDFIAGSCWFSSLDLQSGYWQVELAPEARPKTAFSIGQGLWQVKVMPFGLCNAPDTFEHLMERVLADIPWDRCVVYLETTSSPMLQTLTVHWPI
ncbi:hypothetical protein L3Q82_006504 [Scortum barcoo]|uniref:Uncharacterized protein n=1 Tax=Scortum barcoo TaxID=214431 RepID=A0ACB8WZQ0_9TELE|nr:hypothetical protein L3Q82_006504 [Scortum barcoo]